MFVHGGSSAGLDHSPSVAEIVAWETAFGFQFPHGSIFDRLNTAGVTRRLYAGDSFPTVSALHNIAVTDIRPFHYFQQDLQGPYPYSYVFIEPKYNAAGDYVCGTSQHPLDDVTRGEALIKCTYEAIRNSPVWESSLLIITWDEPGGFYDHVAPPAAIAPADGGAHSSYNFTFEQYGGRVPALAISPWIPRNTIDHSIYDHTSVLATVEKVFRVAPLTHRDAAANNLTSLLSLPAARTDAPERLPDPAVSGVAGCIPVSCWDAPPPAVELARPFDALDVGNLPGVVHAALRHDLQLSPPEMREQILARVSAMQTRAEAAQYLAEVKQKVLALPFRK
jgi:phospholipase C